MDINKLNFNINFSFQIFKSQKLKTKELYIFFREISILISSGLTIVFSLKIMKRNMKNLKIKNNIEDIIRFLNDGNSLSMSFEKTEAFPKIVISLLKIGEECGNIESVGENIYKYYEKKFEMQKKVKSILIYPSVLIVTVIGVVIIIIFNVVPVFEGLIKNLNIKLSTNTVLMLKISKFIRDEYRYLLLAIIIFSLVCFALKIKYKFNMEIIKKIPPFSIINSSFESYIFVESLSLMVTSGVNISKGIEITSGAIDNLRLRIKIIKLNKLVCNGEQFYKAIEDTKILNNYYNSMIFVGEEAGVLEKTLKTISNLMINNLNEKINFFISLISPIAIIIISFVIYGVVSSLIVPIFDALGSI